VTKSTALATSAAGCVPRRRHRSSTGHARARLTALMPLFSRHRDPMLDQIARDTFALFPNCHRCGQRVERFEDADVRVLVQRVVHRGQCPLACLPDPLPDPAEQVP
jgi:hypothetical protein